MLEWKHDVIDAVFLLVAVFIDQATTCTKETLQTALDVTQADVLTLSLNS